MGIKIYQTVNTAENDFPSEFIEAKGIKTVSVLSVSLVYESAESTDSDKYYNHLNFFHLHASFVHQHDFLDHYVCEVNSHKKLEPKIFELGRNERSFKIWFSDYAFKNITLNSQYYFTVELLLEVN